MLTVGSWLHIIDQDKYRLWMCQFTKGHEYMKTGHNIQAGNCLNLFLGWVLCYNNNVKDLRLYGSFTGVGSPHYFRHKQAPE